MGTGVPACDPEAAEGMGCKEQNADLARQGHLNPCPGSTANLLCDTGHIPQPHLSLHVPIFKTETILAHRDSVKRKWDDVAKECTYLRLTSGCYKQCS